MNHLARIPRQPVSREDGPTSFTTDDGLVFVHVDHDAFDYHIKAMPGHSQQTLASALRQCEAQGLTVLEDCEPELDLDGGIKVYLVPTVPVEDTPSARPTRTLFHAAASIFGGVAIYIAMHQENLQAIVSAVAA